jgi:hypothetical protein
MGGRAEGEVLELDGGLWEVVWVEERRARARGERKAARAPKGSRQL